MKGVERQILGRLKPEAAALKATVDDVFRDMVWHKSVHPVSSFLLMELARDPNVPGKLSSFGVGSASIRLPYPEGELKRMRTYIAIYNGVISTLQRFTK